MNSSAHEIKSSILRNELVWEIKRRSFPDAAYALLLVRLWNSFVEGPYSRHKGLHLDSHLGGDSNLSAAMFFLRLKRYGCSSFDVESPLLTLPVEKFILFNGFREDDAVFFSESLLHPKLEVRDGGDYFSQDMRSLSVPPIGDFFFRPEYMLVSGRGFSEDVFTFDYGNKKEKGYHPLWEDYNLPRVELILWVPAIISRLREIHNNHQGMSGLGVIGACMLNIFLRGDPSPFPLAEEFGKKCLDYLIQDWEKTARQFIGWLRRENVKCPFRDGCRVNHHLYILQDQGIRLGVSQSPTAEKISKLLSGFSS